MTFKKKDLMDKVRGDKKNKSEEEKKELLWYQGDNSGDNDKKKYQLFLIKQELILNPSVSCRYIGNYLHIAKDTANRYLRRVRKDIIEGSKNKLKSMKSNTVEEELVKMENEVEALTSKLYEITKSSKRDKDKIAAIRVLFNAKERVFNLKFDAGLFKRSLGEMKLVDVHNLVKAIQDESRGNNNEKRAEL